MMHIPLLQVTAKGPPTSSKVQCTASDSALAALPDLTALVNEVSWSMHFALWLVRPAKAC